MLVFVKKHICKLVFALTVVLISAIFSCDQGVKISSGVVYSSKLKVSAPSRVQVSPLILDKNNVMVYWSPVESAEYYILSYYNADEWKSGAKPNEIYIEDRYQTAYKLSLEKDATRYLFFVRACRYDWETEQLEISDESEYAECVVTPNITIDTQVENDFLHIDFATSSLESLVDSNKMIFTPTFTIYENGEAVANDISNSGSWVSENTIKSNANLNYRIELNLPSGVEVAGKQKSVYADVDFKTDINYTPVPVKSVEVHNNGQKDKIELSFLASPINDGVDDVSLVFEVTRFEVNENKELVSPVVIYDGRKTDNQIELMQDKENQLNYSLTDSTPFASVDYKYFVRTYYRLTSVSDTGDVSNSYYADKGSGDSSYSPLAWIQSNIENFSASISADNNGNVVKKSIVQDGIEKVEYLVDLSWSAKHFDSSKSYFVIKRLDLTTRQPVEEIRAEKVKEQNFQDKIVLTLDEDKFTHRYGYEILYYLDDASTPVSCITSDNIRTLATGNEISYLTDDKVSQTNLNIKKVYVSFKPVSTITLENAGLKEKNLTYYIFRSPEPLGYSIPRFSDAIYSITRDMILASKLDDEGYWTYCDDNNKTGLESGKTYYYSVYGVYEDPLVADSISITNNIVLEAQTAGTIKNFNATLATTLDAILLTWDDIESASFYDVYYRPSGTLSFSKVEGEVIRENGVCKLSLSNQTILDEAGRVYDFKVIPAFDSENGVQYGDFSDIVQGSLFGIYDLNLTVTPIDYDGMDFVNILYLKWDAVKNATGYIVDVYSDDKFEDLVLQERVSAAATSYRFSRDKIVAKTSYPYSSTYRFVVIPCTIINLRDCKVPEASALKKAVASRFINSPPKDITASLGEYNDKILVNWESVPNINSYNLYRREVDPNTFEPLTQSWSLVKSDIYATSYADLPQDQTKVFEYTVSSNDKYYNSKAWKQDYFEDKDNDEIRDNIGYVFSTPTLFGDTKFLSDGIIVFNAIRGADEYVFKIYNAHNPNGREFKNYDNKKFELGGVVEFKINSESYRNAIVEFYATRTTKNGKIISTKSWVKNFLNIYGVTDWHNLAMSKALGKMSAAIGGDWWCSYDADVPRYDIQEDGGGTLSVRARATHGTLSQEATTLWKYGLDSPGGGVFKITNYSACGVVLNITETGFVATDGAHSGSNQLYTIGQTNGGFGRGSSIVFPFGYRVEVSYCRQKVTDMTCGPNFRYSWGNYDWGDVEADFTGCRRDTSMYKRSDAVTSMI